MLESLNGHPDRRLRERGATSHPYRAEHAWSRPEGTK